MGLDIVVGGLAEASRSSTPDAFAELKRPFAALNELLAEAGLAPHREPLDIADGDMFEARVLSLSSLHFLRRMAAYIAFENRLPPQVGTADDESEDPVVERLYGRHDAYLVAPPQRCGLLTMFSPRRRAPPFQHLLMHSDFEGFYLPRAFDDVLVDRADREGLGRYVGSSVRLLEECRLIARRIDLPAGIDPDDPRLDEAVEAPQGGGPPWRAYGVEAHTLARLIRGCEVSLRLGAVLAFT